jgi:hypothetical protein
MHNFVAGSGPDCNKALRVDYLLRNSSGSLAIFTAIRLTSSRVSNFAADLRAVNAAADARPATTSS